LHAAEIFKALSDPLRLRLVFLLTQRDELCVCHLTDILELPQSTVSRHLSHLRTLGLVTTRRQGKWVHYRLQEGADTLLSELLPLIKQLGLHEAQFAADANALPSTDC
jgi:ArsR family transcriptional regulator